MGRYAQVVDGTEANYRRHGLTQTRFSEPVLPCNQVEEFPFH